MAASDKKAQLKILDGGRSLPVSQMHRVLLNAYVTDTRLMGVLAVCIHWNIVSPAADRNDPDSWETLYQFIYIDCEEAGFETYQQIRNEEAGQAAEAAEHIENALTCGLGGARIELEERELRMLLQHWHRFNTARDLPMPAGRENYDFLLSPPLEADPKEQQELMRRICTPITSDEQLVNYFLMRCFGRDYEGARYLTGAGASADEPSGSGLPLDLYDKYVCATFCRNLIRSRRTLQNGSAEYRCESLIEINGSYEIIVSLVSVRDLTVIGFAHGSRLPISNTEAALILKKPEYVDLYEIVLSREDLEDNIDEFTLGFRTTVSVCENGRLFMRYRMHNDHVDRRLFLLSNDVQGLFFLTNGGQLLLCASGPADIHLLEKTLSRSVLAPYLIPGGSWKFLEPVMYEFMHGKYETFEDFLAMMRE